MFFVSNGSFVLSFESKNCRRQKVENHRASFNFFFVITMNQLQIDQRLDYKKPSHAFDVKKRTIAIQSISFRKSFTFTSTQWIHVSSSRTFSYHVGADQMSSVGLSPGSVMSFLQPTIAILLSHGEGKTTSLSSTVVVAITETLASEAPNVCTPKVDIYLNSGWSFILNGAMPRN